MNVRNRDIIDILNVLDRYCGMKLPQHLNYAITRNIIVAQSKYYLYTDELKKILDKYKDDMVRDENGEIKINSKGAPIVKDEIYPEYKKELDELLAKEIDLDIYRVSLDEFNYSDNGGQYDLLTAKDILSLQFIAS